jgi:hypothetical protein
MVGAAVVGGLLLTLSGMAAADRPTRETLTPATWHLTYNKGPEIELLSSPPAVQVTLDGPSTHGGVTPFTVPGNLRGKYAVEVYKPGYVYASGKLDFVFEDINDPTSSPVKASRSRAVMFAMPPGLVEWQDGFRMQGAALMGSGLGAGTGIVWSHSRQVSYDSQASSLYVQAEDATGDRRTELEIEARRAQRHAEAWSKASIEWMAFGGGLWVLNSIARFTSPSLDAEFDADGKLALNLTPVKRSSVALRSLLLPGWGQAYAGRMQASGNFLTGGLSMVMGTLLAHQAYGRAEAELIYSAEYLDYIRKIDPDATREAQQQLDNAQQIADSAWSTRNLTLGLTAAVWAYNLFDAVYFSSGPQTELADDEAPEEPETELSALSPLSGRFGVQLAF